MKLPAALLKAKEVAPSSQAYQAGLPTDGSVVERYQVTGLPTTFFIDRAGVLRSIYRGPLTADTLRENVARIAG